jgi:hypothetical protein
VNSDRPEREAQADLGIAVRKASGAGLQTLPGVKSWRRNSGRLEASTVTA